MAGCGVGALLWLPVTAAIAKQWGVTGVVTQAAVGALIGFVGGVREVGRQ